jgi:hypothetical protein
MHTDKSFEASSQEKSTMKHEGIFSRIVYLLSEPFLGEPHRLPPS